MLDTTSPREPAKVIADILQEEMGLDAEHCLLGDQKWDIPEDQELFAVIYDRSTKVVSTTSYLDTKVDPPVERQFMTALHDMNIEIMSYINGAARLRKEEVGLALESIFARQAMETTNCQICRVQPSVDLSAAELTGMLWRYSIPVRVFSLHFKFKPTNAYSYYTKFNVPPGLAFNPPNGTIDNPEEDLS